jgi:predicted signal transduction protein with EAL and GGDEF domain
MGREFVIVIAVMSFMLFNYQEHKLRDRLIYYLGVSLILCIYLFRNMYVRILLVLIITGTIISLKMLNKEKNNTGLEALLKGLIMLSVLLYWVENGENIKVRYIKLWLRNSTGKS